MLWFPGPHSATGEDCAEFHCHGGLAVIDAVLAALRDLPDTRDAQPGEFTRRALENGRINLNEAEGLADLLSAETALQLANARSLASGQLSRQAERWRERLLHLSAAIEAELDFSDEDDVGPAAQDIRDGVTALSQELRQWLAQPRAERLKEGIRVVLAGPPNAGKSSLFNRLLSYDAAIVSAEPGTTRDAIEQSVVLSGIAITLVDTAGLRSGVDGTVEQLGIEITHKRLEDADLVLWLGEPAIAPRGSITVASKADIMASRKVEGTDYLVSSITGEGIVLLIAAIVQRAARLLPKPGVVAINRRQATAIEEAVAELERPVQGDLLLQAERLRLARRAMDRLTGRVATDDMLDMLFSRFCIGK